MGKCVVCGNEYDKSFQVTMGGETHTFDSFECAIHKLAPRCAGCGIPIMGHGLEKNDSIYCCSACAASSGVEEFTDRV